MNRIFHRRALLRAGLALGASFALPAARGCEYFAPHLRITHPWTRATGAGETVAGLYMKIDASAQADRLIGVETPVAAGAEMAGTATGPGVNLFLPEGQESELSESGVFIRLLGLKHPLEIARSYPLLLEFEKGGIVNATLNIDYARFS
jgi:copper(I)-binding protein